MLEIGMIRSMHLANYTNAGATATATATANANANANTDASRARDVVLKSKMSREETKQRLARLRQKHKARTSLNTLSGVPTTSVVVATTTTEHATTTTTTAPSSKLTCSICLDDMLEKRECKVLECGHVFHFVCIEEWKERREMCPICRFVIE
jgi:hypothetical protein